MKSIYVSKSVGRSLTEYKRLNFDVLVKMCKKYIIYSQFDADKLVGRYVSKPICGAAEVLYGIDELGNEHEMMKIIDSSD